MSEEMKKEEAVVEETAKKNGKGVIVAIVAAIAVIGILVAVYVVLGPKAQSGSKNITVIVTDDTKTDTVYELSTDAEYLREATEEIEGLTIQGEDSEYGFFIQSINGLTADYDTDQAYWAIYVNGEYGNYGIDSQPVADGDEFSFVYEVSTY